jgi:integrase
MHAHLITVLGADRRLATITQRDVDDLAAKLGEGRNGSTVNKVLAELGRLYRHVGATPRFKLERVSAQPKTRWVLPASRVAVLWRHLDGNPAQVAVGLCLLAGLRASEAAAATADWVQGDELHVRVRKTGTANRTAIVPTLGAILPKEGKLVQASENEVCQALRTASRLAGITPAYTGPGAFRHHCATWAHEAGYTQEQVALLLAHKRPGVTGRYLHAQAIGLKREILLRVERTLTDSLHPAPATPHS